MSTFHPFSRLPLELRWRIWELSIEPREVAVGRELSRCSRTPPPSVLHACAESRSHLQSLYTKAFATGTLPKYSLVDFDIDTVYCTQCTLAECEAELPLIRRLVIESQDAETFYRNYGHNLSHAKALETVTILYIGLDAGWDEWFREWDNMMESWYFRDDPVCFYVKILMPEYPSSIEINPDNYLKVERDWRRNNPPPPELLESDYQVSDSDDDISGPGRFRRGWHHVDGCDCPSRRLS